MLKAARQLIYERRKQTNRRVETAFMMRAGDGRYDKDGLMPHTSYEIATKEYQNNPTHIIVAGWLVLPFNSLDRTTHILHHWWNMDLSNEKQFDLTFMHGIGDDYVLDQNLTWNILRRFNYYFTKPVCSSLLQSDRGYRAFDLSDGGEITYRDIKELNFCQLCPNIADIEPY